MKKRFLALIIAAIMVFALAIPCFADEGLTGKLYILHSNDVHGAIDGYEKMAAYRDQLVAQGADVILADAGDYSQGKIEVSYEKGADAVVLMNAVGYDVVTLGNHELDYGYAQLVSNMASRTFTLICADVFEGGSPIFDGPTTIITKGGVSVGFFGMETPETQTKVNPALIKELTFLTDSTDPTIFAQAQSCIDSLRFEGSDIVIGLCHLGVDGESAPYRSTDMYAAVTDLDFVIDAHSHTVMTQGENGEPIQSTGTAFTNIGVIVIDEATKTIEDNFLKPVSEIEESNSAVQEIAQNIHDKVNNALGQKFATSEVELNGDKDPGNRTEETNNGDLITDAMVWALTEKEPGSITRVPADNIVAITNGGGIRAKVAVGDVTKKDINSVLPFGNTLSVVYVKGSVLLEALEASTYCTPLAVGGFPQISGMHITIDTTKEYDKGELYPGSTYHAPNSINRVTIDDVNGQPFDPNATYAVITNNFITAGGDTYYSFAASSDQFDTGRPLDEIVIEYISEKLGGVISADQYAEPQGRIIIKTTADEEEPPVSPPTFDATLISLYVMIACAFVFMVALPWEKKY